MRAQNRLIAFAARYVSVTTSTSSRFGFSAKRTLILPATSVTSSTCPSCSRGTSLGRLDAHAAGSSCRRSRSPGRTSISTRSQEYGAGGVLSALTNANQQLDQANRATAVADLRKQASGEVPMRLARQAARAAVERSFAMPLVAAGFKDAKVVARFPTEGHRRALLLDLSTPYDEAIKEAERRRAAEGQK